MDAIVVVRYQSLEVVAVQEVVMKNEVVIVQVFAVVSDLNKAHVSDLTIGNMQNIAVRKALFSLISSLDIQVERVVVFLNVTLDVLVFINDFRND